MSKALFPAEAYPDDIALAEGLHAIFRVGGGHSVTVLDRRPNPWGGTFPAEIVTVRLDDPRAFRVFCKYETGASAGSYGHRGGVAYEWKVYRDLLHPLSLTVPGYYGCYEDERRGWLWFVLEYLDGSLPLTKAPERDAIVRAARWIGAFHSSMESHVRCDIPSSLLRYDRAYYRGWTERAHSRCLSQGMTVDWMPVLRRRFEDAVHALLEGPFTVIHGEYYPKNIRWQAGTIRPVDWESTAIGPGEVDVASLTEKWPDEYTRECEWVYSQTRWPLGTPVGFDRRLDLARLYLHFRWLASLSGWRRPDAATWRIEQIRRIAERQGLL